MIGAAAATRRRRRHPWAFRYVPGDTLPVGAFSRASVATEYDASGVVATTASGVARDAHYLGGVRTLLLEGQRTNLVTQSDPTAAQVAGGGANRVVDAPVTEFGFTAGVRILGNTGNTETAYVSFTADGTTAYVPSLFIVMDDGSAPRVTTSTADPNTDFSVVVGSSIASGAAVRHVAGALYRVVGAPTTPAAGGKYWGPARFTGQSQKAFRVTGYQVEVGTVGSSYIPTAGATSTRVADALSLPGVTTGTATLYERWLDPVTAAVSDSASAYTSGATITPAVDRAYTHVVVFADTLTAADCRARLGLA